jgi:small conductance mechanosensitive channel
MLDAAGPHAHLSLDTKGKALRGLHVVIIICAAIMLQALSTLAISAHMQAQQASREGASCKHQTLAAVGIHAATWAISIVATILVLERVGVPLKTLLAVSGVGALIVGIGARAMIRDFFASLLIIGEKQFYHGEEVTIYGPVMNLYLTGLVESVNLRTTELRQRDGALVFIPNGGISAVANFSRGSVRVRIDLELPHAMATPAAFTALRNYVERSRSMAHVDNIAAIGTTRVFGMHVVYSIVAVTSAEFRNEITGKLNRGAWRALQPFLKP